MHGEFETDMSELVYTQGIAVDGPAILCNGEPITPEVIVALLNKNIDRKYKDMDMYTAARETLNCALHWEGDARLIGNVRAEDIAAFSADYLRMKLNSGIDDVPSISALEI